MSLQPSSIFKKQYTYMERKIVLFYSSLVFFLTGRVCWWDSNLGSQRFSNLVVRLCTATHACTTLIFTHFTFFTKI